jgi:hypothetical protein
MRVNESAAFARSPREKRNLVDDRVDVWAGTLFCDYRCGRVGVSPEARDELGREHVQIVGPSVMAERPAHLDARLARCLNHVSQQPEVEDLAAFAPRPVHGFARDPDADGAQTKVVVAQLNVVLCVGGEVQPMAVTVDVTG